MSTLTNPSSDSGRRPSTVIGPHAIMPLSGSAEISTGRHHTRHVAQPLPQLAIGLERLVCVGVLAPRQRQLEGQDAGRREAGLDLLQSHEAADQQPGADQQHHRQRELADHQQPAQ